MYRVNNVVLWVSRSDEIIRASSLSAILFPSATFHLIAVIPRIKSRFFLTSLYSEVMQSIVHEALDSVELELLRRGIHVIRKVILRGRAPGAVANYAEKVDADLIVSATAVELSEEEIIENPVAKLLNVVQRPVLIYTALSRISEMPNSIAIVSRSRVPNIALGFALNLAHGRNIDLTLFLTEKLSPGELETLSMYNRRYGARVFIEVLKTSREELTKDVAKLTREHDLLIVDRALFEEYRPLPPKRKILGDLEKILIAVSHSPLLFV